MGGDRGSRSKCFAKMYFEKSSQREGLTPKLVFLKMRGTNNNS